MLTQELLMVNLGQEADATFEATSILSFKVVESPQAHSEPLQHLDLHLMLFK